MKQLITQLFGFFIEFVNRSKTAPPPFFRKIQAVCILLSVFVGASILLEWNIPVLKHFLNVETILVLLAAAGMSQTPNVDKPVQKTSDEGEGGQAGGSVGSRPNDRNT